MAATSQWRPCAAACGCFGVSIAEARLAQQTRMNSPNLYVYAENNPVNLMDPSGMQASGQKQIGGRKQPNCQPVVYMCTRDIGISTHTFFWIHYPCATGQDRYIGYGPGGSTTMPEIGDDRNAVEGGTAHCHRTNCSVDCITRQGQRIGRDWKISVGLGKGQYIAIWERKNCHGFVETAVDECHCGWSFHGFVPDPKPKAK